MPMTLPVMFLSSFRRVLLAAALLWPVLMVTATAGSVTVFAAASLQTALDEIASAWEAETGHDVVLSMAGSAVLARQIEAGAPADLYFPANVAWMDYLQEREMVRGETRRELLGNRLVLIAPAGGAGAAEIERGLDLAGLLGDGRLAMALVDAVPAGTYGKAALENYGLWPSVGDSVVQTDNVRLALALVSRREASLGIVYATDAAADPTVEIVAEFPADSHEAIIYPAALVTESTSPEAEAFLDYLSGPEARAVFVRQGFSIPGVS